MRNIAAIFLALMLAAPLAARAENEAPVDPNPGFVRALQKALADNDARWFSEHMRYPVRWFGPRKQHVMISGAQYVRSHWKGLIGPVLRNAIMAQDPENCFRNYQGTMIGAGLHNIWANAAFNAPASQLMIVTINDDE